MRKFSQRAVGRPYRLALALAFLNLSTAMPVWAQDQGSSQMPAAEEQPAQAQGELPLSGPAYRIATEAYNAFARRDYETAITQAREAIRQRPDVGRLRVLLAEALAASGKRDEARTEARQAANDPRLSSAARAQLSTLAAAEPAPAAPPAAQVSEPQPAPPPVASPAAPPAAKAGTSTQSSPAYQAADAAYRAYARRSYNLAVTKAREAVKLSPGNKAYRTLLANSLAAQKLARKPAVQAQAPVDQAASSAYAIAARITQLNKEGRRQDARRLFAEARDAGNLKALKPADLGYLATQAGDNEMAYEAFQQAKRAGELHGTQLIDAAYAARRAFHNEEAVALLHEAIDAEERGDFSLPPQRLFGLRREVADLTREFGFNSTLSYGSSGVSSGSFRPLDSSAGKILQHGSEVYWRPRGIGYRDGAIFELFARQFTTLNDSRDGPTGFPTMQGSVGARWKPFARYNLVLEASKLFKIGEHSRNDTLLRAAFGDSFGTDLRVDVPSWWTGQYYAEIGRYMESGQNIANGEARIGRSYRMDGIDKNLVVTPFLAVAPSYDSDLDKQFALGAGPGINARYWFREDKYTAPRSYVDFTVQYRAKLSGDDRAKGFFGAISVAY
ncbi:adsorption protein A [Phyllobacterium leguminum]|uniref:Adsorption protein A n=1 Tax=Phyllobacterium leguminum TaxID=314237 RepID=A0A318T6G5_9HYPH|nr:adsorption protein A [Phyllobacterium leguminum]